MQVAVQISDPLLTFLSPFEVVNACADIRVYLAVEEFREVCSQLPCVRKVQPLRFTDFYKLGKETRQFL